MAWNRKFVLCVLLLACVFPARATIFGTVRGIIHDPQHRPIQNAAVKLKSKTSDWNQSASTDANGEFQFISVPFGDYSVTVSAQGFEDATQDVTVLSGSVAVTHVQLQIATAKQSLTVTGNVEVAPTDTPTPTTLVNRQDIERTPGADRTNSLAMITDFVPGSYSLTICFISEAATRRFGCWTAFP